MATAIKGVRPERQYELEQYRRQLRETRIKYQAENAGRPSKATQEAMQRAIKSQRRQTRWSEYIADLKTLLANPESIIYRDRHPCRPIVDYSKTHAQRVEAQLNLAHALGRHQIARRKYLAVLRQEIDSLGNCITRDNLDAKIDYALSNPVNFSVLPTELVERRDDIMRKLRLIKVPMDQGITICSLPAEEDLLDTCTDGHNNGSGTCDSNKRQ